MRRYVIVETATGNVKSVWQGGDEQDITAPEGCLKIAIVTDDTTDYTRKRWNGRSFDDIPPAPPSRILLPIDFVRRFTIDEDIAIDTLADTNKRVKAWRRRLEIVTSVRLDHPEVIAGLAYLKSVGIPFIWPDEATADVRIAAIRA